MPSKIFARAAILALTSLMLYASGVRAQSAIAGVVRDSTGGVLPGVTVEASSPVLIEKVRTVTSDDHGEYRIVSLRPGNYTVTFTLTGFNTVRREEIDLPANFTATVNADLRVGSLEETVTVSGASAVVDVETTAKAQVLPRDVIDAVPTGRSIQGLGQLVVGVSMNIPDVGGSQAAQQTYFTVHGMSRSQTFVEIDGLLIKGITADGGSEPYMNTANSQEMVYQTSGANADASSGGLRLNVIPRAGGNQFSGAVFSSLADGKWQSDNFSQELKDKGLRAVDKIDRLSDVNVSGGGPIKLDRLWLFGSTRVAVVNKPVADTFYPNGEQGIDDNTIRNYNVHLTWQIDQRNKLAVYMERSFKERGHSMSAGDDPLTASQHQTPPLHMTNMIKLTSTVSSKLLVEVGYSGNVANQLYLYQDGIEKPYGTPEWFAGASRADLALGTRTTAASTFRGEDAARYNTQGSVSYVTGSHSYKFGAQDTWGHSRQFSNTNADLNQQYMNGAPFSAVVYNTPVRFQGLMKPDIGIFGQDSWKFGRLTVNYGARWEYFAQVVAKEVSTQGRFVGNREFGPQTVGQWKTFSPRSGLVFDLFGNAKTAIKFGVNKYQLSGTTGLIDAYNPMSLSSATVGWTDVNGDDIAQNEELRLTQLAANFGVVTPGCSVVAGSAAVPCGTAQVDPDLKRRYSIEYNVGVQHEVLPRVSVTANWFHRDFYNLMVRQNVLQTFSDYAPVQIASPLDGSVITMFNVSAAKVNQVQYLDTNAPDRRHVYNAFEFGFNARLPRGMTLFGGTTTERMLAVTCDEPSNPNNLLYCDQTKTGVPYTTQLKLVATVPLRWGIQLSGSWQSLPGYSLGTAALSGVTGVTAASQGVGTVWLIGPTTRYPANCKGPCTPGALVNPGMTVASMPVPLIPPGTEFADRVNQLDVTVGKWFTLRGGKMRFQPEVSLFNAFNSSAVLSVRSLNYLTASYLQPSSILPARIVRVAAQLKW